MIISEKLTNSLRNAGITSGFTFNNKDTNKMLNTLYLGVIAESLASIADKLGDISLPVENPGSEIDCCHKETEENQNSCDHCCGECKHCYANETMNFNLWCSKNNNGVGFRQGACDDFEADDDDDEEEEAK